MKRRLAVPSILLLASASAAGQEPTYVSSIGMEFVRIPAGSFVMSKFQPTCPLEGGKVEWTPEDFATCRELAKRDARPGFTMTVGRPFYLAKYEVTQAQWKKVMGNNPSVFQGSRVKDDADLHPVDSVTWEDAQAFIRKLNAMEKTAAYRLPTETEWEYAARAGAVEEPPKEELEQYAWQSGSYARPRPPNPDTSKPTTHVVGQKKPNAWGLYDMLGNVWEWVQNYYNEQRLAGPEPPAAGNTHVLRGGSFLGDRKNVRFSEHAGGPGSGFDVGFRIVRESR
ncbi:MAG: formylglycine-generating enzyme family protein [Acidobacteriia bacterium]|nr:formylglycine-generating enzyme family protein [Terriglobia bacterium]